VATALAQCVAFDAKTLTNQAVNRSGEVGCRITIGCNGAAKPTCLKWLINSRRPLNRNVVTRLGLPEVVVQSSQLHRLLVMLEWFDGDLNMTVEQAINDISAMPPSDQLRVVQAIWDRLPDGVGTELSDLQRAELDRRWAEYKANPSTALSEEEFRERIRVARGR
jgi:putative addiction module component (TIGR02574 family)